MRILYGVAGVGLGHSSRASTIIRHLESKGHKVKVITYGQAYEVMKDKFDVFRANGPSLVFKKGVLKKRLTLKVNSTNLPKNVWRWRKFYELMRNFSPQLCITDMDPLVPILSNWYRLPLISLDNQHRLTNIQLEIPREHYQEYLAARAVTNTFVRRAEAFIITDFTKGKINKPKTFLVPPILRADVIKSKPKNGSKILVYLSRKDKTTLSALKKIPEKFVIYGYNKKAKKGNCEFKTKETFLEDLKGCKAIIATAGFTLICEALYLKKPYLALPLKGQFEQMLNALELKKAGYGDYAEVITPDKINDFISQLSKYELKLKNYKPDNYKLLSVLDKEITKIKSHISSKRTS